jgi:DNA mismatch endonuclease, patch repair protein
MASRTPSFAGLKPASAASSRVKGNNRRSDTKQERILRRELWQLGLRYRKNVKSLVGKPDIVFAKARLVVFCDGDFWHGRNWRSLRAKLRHGTNAAYWLAKIGRNRDRDRQVSKMLSKAGWQVIRVWETDIKRDPVAIALRIKKMVATRLQLKK